MKQLIISIVMYFSFIILVSILDTKKTFYKNCELIAFIKRDGQIVYKKGLFTQIIDTNGDYKPDYTNTSICSRFGYISTNLPVSTEDKAVFKKFVQNKF